MTGRIISGFEESRTRQSEREARKQHEARIEAEPLAREEAKRREAEQEAARWDAFARLMNDWNTARTARAFIATVEQHGLSAELKLDGFKLDELLEWAKGPVDRIDPLTRQHMRSEVETGQEDDVE